MVKVNSEYQLADASDSGIDRRQMMARLTAVLGMPLSAPIAAAVLSGCSPTPANASTWSGLKSDQLQLVGRITDLIIPETDTPGALAAGVPDYINMMLSEWYEAEQRDVFILGLTDLDSRASAEFETEFLDCASVEQTALLNELDAEVFTNGDHQTFFGLMKEMTLVGYYSSEIGAQQELRYEAVPGPYRGCLPFEDIGRTWAT